MVGSLRNALGGHGYFESADKEGQVLNESHGNEGVKQGRKRRTFREA